LKRSKVLTALLGLTLILAACGSDAEPGTTTSAGDTSTTNAGETTTTGADSTGGISTADTGLGTILVDGDGFTLYVFTADTEGESTCYDGCADKWPAVSAGVEIGSGLDDSLFGSVARTDGGDQLTVNGQPLYRYAPDSNPGDTKGQGLGGVWFAVDANGAKVGAA
jgi:predicted lipoprotein with Yx(FWY)xxD motif